MPNIETVLDSVLRLPASTVWKGAWESEALSRISRLAAGLIDTDTGQLRAGWEQLDDPSYLRSVVSLSIPELVERLLERKGELNTGLKAGGCNEQSTGQLRKKLAAVVPSHVNRPENDEVFRSPFPRSWRSVADILASELHARHGKGEIEPEWMLLNRLLLISFLSASELPKARLLADNMRRLSGSMLGVRGALTRIVEVISPKGITDPPLPISPRAGGITLAHRSLSRLLEATELQSAAIANGLGLMNQFLGGPVPPLPPGVTVQQVLQGRVVVYRQYEHCIQVFMALGSIEQLLRAWATLAKVDHMKNPTHPRSATDWLKDLNCSAPLQARLESLYAGVRNRAIHGNLLEVRSRQSEFLSRPPGTPFLMTPLSPENISQTCLEALEALDVEMSSLSTRVSAGDLSWTVSLQLSTADVAFVTSLPRPYSRFPSPTEWKDFITHHLTAVMPWGSKLFRLGLMGWLQPRPASDFNGAAFYSLLATFEGLYRLTAHILGVEITQAVRTEGHFQYLMLDARGLARNEVIDSFCRLLPADERTTAARILRLAISVRNAASHGAFTTFDQAGCAALGATLVHSITYLLRALRKHMTLEAAYYKWKGRGAPGGGDGREDWFPAEKELSARVKEVVD